MTKGEFKKILKRGFKIYSKKGKKFGWSKTNEIKFTQEGEITVISRENKDVYLTSLTTIPEGVRFENKGHVYLDFLTAIPKGITFENKGCVSLLSLTNLPKETRFENDGSVDLRSLTTITEGKMFENKGDVWLNSKITRFNPIFRNKRDIHLISYHNKTKGITQDQDQHGTKIVFKN